MTIYYPYAFSSLGTKGNIPADGDAQQYVQARHLNRLFREVSAIESVLGVGLSGTHADLKTRLSQNLGDGGLAYGTPAAEMACEGDPSGGTSGTTRYFDAQGHSVTFPNNENPAKQRARLLRLAYTAWDVPPVVHFTLNSTAQKPELNGRQAIIAISEVGVQVMFSRHDGSWTEDESIGGWLAVLAISRDPMVYEEDAAWILPPVRTGA